MMRGATQIAARAVMGLALAHSALVEPVENGQLEITIFGAGDIPPFRLTPQAWAVAVNAALNEGALPDLLLRRQALGLTREQLAARAGVHADTVRDLESGRRTPHAVTLAALRGALEHFERARVPNEERGP